MHDIIFRGAEILDGSDNGAVRGDVAVRDGVISRIGSTIAEPAAKVIQADGMYLAPGFIDVHRHSDAFVFHDGFGESELRQGITTTINGNCGLSIVPCPPKWRHEILSYLRPITGSLPDGVAFESFSDYLAKLRDVSLPLNFGMHIGDGTLRMAAKGFAAGPMERDEIATVHRYLEDALAAGAFGVSLGVVYAPENNYDLEGLVEALAPMADSGVPLVTHIRGEGDLLIPSLKEVIAVARRLSVPLHVSHFKCVGARNWSHLLRDAIRLLDEERESGLDITCDVYPWNAGSTQFVQVLPPEFLKGGLEETTRRMRDPAERARCREILSRRQTSFDNQVDLIGWNNIMVTTVKTEGNKRYEGMRVTEIAAERKVDPYDAAFDLLAEEDCAVSMINFIVSDDDIATILNYPHSIVVSDSIYPEGGLPHPRQFGTIPKLLAEIVRDNKILTLPKAISKITSGPARRFGIEGKGAIKEGYDADLVLFDLAAIRNNASYTRPKGLGEGLKCVLVNGKIANQDDTFINSGAGKIMRRG